ncbi:MAG: histidinol-phosphate transaminase [Albidovulum sp.]|nr:histidinol-phosphate transaminase [Albidovulum sp.]MDE0529997.1 histidinol-phosphate transaminase [Albidovulum sp.]
MNRMLKPQPGILGIEAYEAGESSIAGREAVLKLSSNENPYGPSQKAIDAYLAAASKLSRYPDSHHGSLRNAIAEVYGLLPDKLVCGAGSDEVIALLCQAYAGEGDEIIHTEHGFLMYPILAKAVGATPVQVRERNRRTDPESILEACGPDTRIVLIANPNNPTGTMISSDEARELADSLPEGVLLVLDGAYVEYADGYDGGASLVESCANVVMTRTFSKIYGLAALRIGYAYGPEDLIAAMDRIREPFNVGAPSLAAAEAAVRDTEHARRCRELNARWRRWLSERLEECGIPSDPSSANFILARFADPETVSRCDSFLRSRGILVRRMEKYNLPKCLRISIGDEAGCRSLASALNEFMAGDR